MGYAESDEAESDEGDEESVETRDDALSDVGKLASKLRDPCRGQPDSPVLGGLPTGTSCAFDFEGNPSAVPLQDGYDLFRCVNGVTVFFDCRSIGLDLCATSSYDPPVQGYSQLTYCTYTGY